MIPSFPTFTPSTAIFPALTLERVVSEAFPSSISPVVVSVVADATPSIGVTRVGEVAKTLAPLPVSSVRAVASCAELNEPKTAALPVEVICPVRLAFVVTFPAVRPAAVPVTFVITPDAGVPRAGAMRACPLGSTTVPVKVGDARLAFRLSAVVTKAVVAIAVVLFQAVCVVAIVHVGSVGVPVKVGEARAALASRAVCNPVVLAIDSAASAIAVAFPVEVTTPVRLAFVVTFPAVSPEAVPVTFVITPDAGVPRAGVMRACPLGSTTVPVKVGEARAALASSAVCNPVVLAIDSAASAIAVALPVEVTTPVRFAFVVTFPAVSPEAVPVTFVITPLTGVPSAGAIRACQLGKTTVPVNVGDARRASSAVSDRLVAAIVMFAEPLNDTPAMVRAV